MNSNSLRKCDILPTRALEKFSSWAGRNLSGEKAHLYTLWKDLKSYFEINKQSNKHLRGLQAEHIHRSHFLLRDKKLVICSVTYLRLE